MQQVIGPLLSRQLGLYSFNRSEERGHSSPVLIRSVRKEDAVAERVFVDALSPRTGRYRFLGQAPHLDTETAGGESQDVAFAAVVREDGKDKFVGVGRYRATAFGPDCECAVALLDDWETESLEASLMQQLLEVAMRRGITRMWSLDSAGKLASPLLGFPAPKES